jgi:hypothetical protein
MGYMNIKSSGTYTFDVAAVADVQLRIGVSVKAIMIETDGALRFAGHPMFLSDPQRIRVTQVGAPAVTALNYTEIRGQKIYNISPMIVAENTEIQFTITNASGAIRMVQIDFIE